MSSRSQRYDLIVIGGGAAGFFGAINAAGLSFMHQINAIRTLEKEILGNMSKENEKLKSNNLALEKTKKDLEATTGQLQQTKDKLEESVQQLQIENEKQKKEFDANNQDLRTQIQELTLIIAGLTGLSNRIKSDTEQSEKNTQIAQDILSQMPSHIDKAQLVLNTMKKQFETQDQTFSQHIDAIKKFFDNTNVISILQDINATRAEQTKAYADYAQFKEDFGKERALLEEIRKNFAHLHEQLRADEQGIQTGVQAFTTQNKELGQMLITLRQFLPCHLSTGSTQ